MDKIWFILINDEKEGPYTPLELKNDLRVNPDVLVWKEGFPEWIAIRFVPELADLFKEETQAQQEEDISEPLATDLMQDQAVIAMQQDPSQWILWVIVLLLLLFYTFYQFQS